MLAMVLFINFSDGTAREASFLAFQVFHFLLNMSLKLRACTRMQRLRPNPVHLQLATSTSQLPEKLGSGLLRTAWYLPWKEGGKEGGKQRKREGKEGGRDGGKEGGRMKHLFIHFLPHWFAPQGTELPHAAGYICWTGPSSLSATKGSRAKK